MNKRESRKYVATIRTPHSAEIAVVTLTFIGVVPRNDSVNRSHLRTVQEAIDYMIPEQYQILSCKKATA